MNKRTTATTLGIVVVVVALAAYVAATPYLAVHRLQAAVKRHDSAALSSLVDYASVREGLKDQLHATLAGNVARSQPRQHRALATLGGIAAGLAADRILNQWATPAGISRLLEGTAPMLDSMGTTRPGTPTGPDDVEPGQGSMPVASMSYESFDKFVAHVKNSGHGEIRFVLQRRGLGWKLTDIVLPHG